MGRTPMTFTPSYEEFVDFNGFIKTMENAGALEAGIAKVIPPAEWVTGLSLGTLKDACVGKRINPIEQTFAPTKREIGRMPLKCIDGMFDVFASERKSVAVRTFIKQQTKQAPVIEFPKYWTSIEDPHHEPSIYGADFDASLFNESAGTWNLSNLQTVLRDKCDVPGITSPYIYLGDYRTTFPWHIEDKDVYSISYLHSGSPKCWFAIPPSDGARFQERISVLAPSKFRKCAAYFRHKSLLIDPRELSYATDMLIHEEGQFVVTFPFAYHQGFNSGVNVAEAVNFGSERWLKYGENCLECHCEEDKGVKDDIDMGASTSAGNERHPEFGRCEKCARFGSGMKNYNKGWLCQHRRRANSSHFTKKPPP